MEHKFITYVRTIHFMNLRHDNLDVFAPVYVSYTELRERFFLTTKDINRFVESGILEVSERMSSGGNGQRLFKVLVPGPIDLSLIPTRESKPLSHTTYKMRQYLGDVSLIPGSPKTFYFDAFLRHFMYRPDLFFLVDSFSGRVHTPVTNFKSEYRENILLKGQTTTSLDVATMQPLLLAKILKSKIGSNEFSFWLDDGQDIYKILQDKTGLSSRGEAKKLFFQILFSKPNEDLKKLFGSASWITWINEFKGTPLVSNPQPQDKMHNNLAWLLQTTEVEVMTKVWQELVIKNIPFLSVHDEIIVQLKDFLQAEMIFSDILSVEFPFFRLNKKSHTDAIAQIEDVPNVLNEDQKIKIISPPKNAPGNDNTISLSIINKLDIYVEKNPFLKQLTNTLSLVPDTDQSPDTGWQNDIPATIIKVGQEIMPETVYHIDEIKALIKKHHSALTINYEKIIRELLIQKVIIKNELNNNHFYKYGSTPF